MPLRCSPHRLLCLAVSLHRPTGWPRDSRSPGQSASPEHPSPRPCFLPWPILVPDASSRSLTWDGTQSTCHWAGSCFPQLSPPVLCAKLPTDYGSSLFLSVSKLSPALEALPEARSHAVGSHFPHRPVALAPNPKSVASNPLTSGVPLPHQEARNLLKLYSSALRILLSGGINLGKWGREFREMNVSSLCEGLRRLPTSYARQTIPHLIVKIRSYIRASYSNLCGLSNDTGPSRSHPPLRSQS